METLFGRRKDIQDIDMNSQLKNCVVIARDGVNAENAGAVFCHLTGDEQVF